MHTTVTSRHFSLRSFFLWVLLLSLSFALFRFALAMDSELLFVSVLGSLCGAFVIALVALQRCWRYATLAFVVFLGIYSAIYVGLSVNGRYEPGTWGLDGVKWYIWVPAGFVHDDDHWNLRLVWTFAPLYYVDRRFWHTDDESESGRYPIYRGHVQKKPGFCEGRVAQC